MAGMLKEKCRPRFLRFAWVVLFKVHLIRLLKHSLGYFCLWVSLPSFHIIFRRCFVGAVGENKEMKGDRGRTNSPCGNATSETISEGFESVPGMHSKALHMVSGVLGKYGRH